MKVIVACPKCHIEPSVAWQWLCDECSHHWNVFEKEGGCPNCSNRPFNVLCLNDFNGCGMSSPYQDWLRFEQDISTELWDDELKRQFRREGFY